MKKRVSMLMASLLAIAIIGIGPVMAQTIQEKVTITPGKTISAAEESAISSAAAKVLRHIATARGAIHDKDLEQAQADLKQAHKLIDIIKASLPTAKVKDHIWVARKHLDYKSTEDVIQDLIPIYAELDDIEDFVPVAQAKKHLDAAKKSLKKGDKKLAKESLRAADAALIYTEVDLPLASTEKHVIAAQRLLARDKPDKADEALQAAEDNVQFIAVASEAPINQAKKNLWQATKDYVAGKYAAAKADLEQARVYLKQAAQSSDEKIRKEARKLEKDVDALTGKVEKGGKDTGAAITGVWERSKALSEREAERVSTGWQKIHAEGRTKADLIEAKLHLAYAESYQFTTANMAKAKCEIEQAGTYLKNASKHADSATKAKIDAMKKEIGKIKTDLNSNTEVTRARYIKIKGDLRQLIRDL